MSSYVGHGCRTSTNANPLCVIALFIVSFRCLTSYEYERAIKVNPETNANAMGFTELLVLGVTRDFVFSPNLNVGEACPLVRP